MMFCLNGSGKAGHGSYTKMMCIEIYTKVLQKEEGYHEYASPCSSIFSN